MLHHRPIRPAIRLRRLGRTPVQCFNLSLVANGLGFGAVGVRAAAEQDPDDGHRPPRRVHGRLSSVQVGRQCTLLELVSRRDLTQVAVVAGYQGESAQCLPLATK